MIGTRRQLFKASVLSAFGVGSALTLAGCRFEFLPNGPIASFAYEPVFARSDDGSKWYIFAVDTAGQYQRQRAFWTAKGNVGAPPFDTVAVFEHLHAVNKLTVQTGPISLRGVRYEIDRDGYVEPQSSSQSYVSALKWNEINHQGKK